MRELTADLLVASRCRLGEGPTWDRVSSAVAWLDVRQDLLHRWSERPGHLVTELPLAVTCAVRDDGDGWVVASGRSIRRLSGDGRSVVGEIATLPAPDDVVANDGRVDPHGRLWVGTVDRTGAGRGALFVVTGDGAVEQVRAGLAMSNGIDWSPDGRNCYHVDTGGGRVAVLSLDHDGDVIDESTFVDTGAMPDGLTVDAEGGIWVAFWDLRVVRRFSPTGILDIEVAVPEADHVTSCAFGPPTSTELYITTARRAASAVEAAQPAVHSGGLFVVDVGVPGRGYTDFRLGGA